MSSMHFQDKLCIQQNIDFNLSASNISDAMQVVNIQNALS